MVEGAGLPSIQGLAMGTDPVARPFALEVVAARQAFPGLPTGSDPGFPRDLLEFIRVDHGKVKGKLFGHYRVPASLKAS